MDEKPKNPVDNASDVDIIDELTDEQRARHYKSIAAAKAGRTIPHEVMKAEIEKWLRK